MISLLKFSTSSSRRFAFTLIELLVVIAIIGLLAAILFPVFSRARENARRASCGSNLRQIGLGVQQYLQDYDELYPFVYYDGSSWQPYGSPAAPVIQTFPYIKSLQVWHCPSQNPPNGNIAQKYLNGITYRTQYIFNGYYLKTTSNTPVSVAKIGSPAEKIEMAEIRGATCVIDGWSQILPNNRVASPHLEGMNLLFGDGHVKWLSSKVVQADTNEAAKYWGYTARYGTYDYN